MSLRDRVLSGDREQPPLALVVGSGLFAGAMVLPLAWLVLEALQVDPDRAWRLATQELTQAVLRNSLLLAAGVTAGSVLLGVPLAYLTVRTDLPFRRLWTVLVALPLVVPSYVGAFAVVSAFGPHGEFQDVLAPLGVDAIPRIYGLPGAILVITLYTYPYVYLTTRAGLLSFDVQLVDAARTLNHGRLSAFWRVTLPRIRPAIAAGTLLAALYALSDFGTPAIMQLPVFTRQIYVEMNAGGLDYASLLSLQLLAVVLLVLVLERWIRPDESGATESTARRDRPVRLGRWRWPATLLPAGIAAVALGVPLWILGLWLVHADTGQRATLAFEWSHAFNSVLVSAGAALVAALAALPIGYLAARYDSRLAAVFERATYLGFAVPGIVLGLALVYFGTGYAPRLYHTLWLLVFAYVVRFVPQAVGSIRAGTVQVDQRLVEAARTLGEGPVSAFRRVTLPLLTPGLVAGAALVFLTTMKELPITLVLRPTGFDTIVTQIWRAQAQSQFQYAAFPALLLLAISGLSMVVLLAQDGGERGL